MWAEDFLIFDLHVGELWDRRSSDCAGTSRRQILQWELEQRATLCVGKTARTE
jgi:hypothetical protein